MERRGGVVAGGTKAHANDLVSEVDLASERLIVDALTAACPDDGVLAEEGTSFPGSTGWRWVIDPLDGTRNYLTGAGPWSVCIALQEGETTRVAAVHDPVVGETFSAVAGQGSVLGRDPLRVSPLTRIEQALVGLSFNPSPGDEAADGRDHHRAPAGYRRRAPRCRPPLVSSTSRPAGWTRLSWSTRNRGTSPQACSLPPKPGQSSVELSHAGVGLIVTAPPALVPDLVRLLPPAACAVRSAPAAGPARRPSAPASPRSAPAAR